jgi:hypothetical protein
LEIRTPNEPTIGYMRAKRVATIPESFRAPEAAAAKRTRSSATWDSTPSRSPISLHNDSIELSLSHLSFIYMNHEVSWYW